jgi:hypothetical protein
VHFPFCLLAIALAGIARKATRGAMPGQCPHNAVATARFMRSF